MTTTTRWTTVTADPNSVAAHAHRARVLASAVRCPVPDRVSFLEDAATGKRVLDIGVVNHTAEATVAVNWLHDRVRAAAEYCLGIDILGPAIDHLRIRGYNVRAFDITSHDHLGEMFDVIVAGEVIEHLGEPQSLFTFAREHLVPGGRLVLSTPHPYYLTRVLQFARRLDHESSDHVALFFPSGMAELAERVGLKLVEYRGVEVPLRTWKGRILKKLFRQLGWSPELLCDTLLFTFAVGGEET